MIELAAGITLALSIVKTEHFDVCKTCRELHPKVQIEYEINDNWTAAVGAYLNSKDRMSYTAGLRWQPNALWIEGGVVTGYRDGKPLPMARVGVSVSDSVDVFAFPILHEDELKAGVGVEWGF